MYVYQCVLNIPNICFGSPSRRTSPIITLLQHAQRLFQCLRTQQVFQPRRPLVQNPLWVEGGATELQNYGILPVVSHENMPIQLGSQPPFTRVTQDHSPVVALIGQQSSSIHVPTSVDFWSTKAIIAKPKKKISSLSHASGVIFKISNLISLHQVPRIPPFKTGPNRPHGYSFGSRQVNQVLRHCHLWPPTSWWTIFGDLQYPLVN